jgi:hypothetical protein
MALGPGDAESQFIGRVDTVLLESPAMDNKFFHLETKGEERGRKELRKNAPLKSGWTLGTDWRVQARFHVRSSFIGHMKEDTRIKLVGDNRLRMRVGNFFAWSSGKLAVLAPIDTTPDPNVDTVLAQSVASQSVAAEFNSAAHVRVSHDTVSVTVLTGSVVLRGPAGMTLVRGGETGTIRGRERPVLRKASTEAWRELRAWENSVRPAVRSARKLRRLQTISRGAGLSSGVGGPDVREPALGVLGPSPPGRVDIVVLPPGK